MATLVESPPAAPTLTPPGEEDLQLEAGEGEGPPKPKGDEYPTGQKMSSIEDDLMGELTMEELKEAFRLFDTEGVGFITIEIFMDILRELDDEWTEDDIIGIVSDIDVDGSGTIDFEEFVKIMT